MQREFSLEPILIHHQPLPSQKSWVKIFTYEPAEAELVATRGRMYAVLSVSARTEVDFSPVMQLILEDLHKEYFEKTEGGILAVLEQALDGIHKKLILMAQKDKRLSSGFSFNLLAAVSWGTTLYFGQLGVSRASLLRRDRLYDIDEGEQKSAGLYLSSGSLKAGDRVLLATQELFEGVDRQVLTELLQLPASDLAGALEKELEKSPDDKRLLQSGMVLLVDIKEVPTVSEEGLQIKEVEGSEVKGDGVRAELGLGEVVEGFGGRVKGWVERLFGWRVMGQIPGLPLVIVVVAVVLLAVSVWQPRFEFSAPVVEKNDSQSPTEVVEVSEARITLAEVERVMDEDLGQAVKLWREVGDFLQQHKDKIAQQAGLAELQSDWQRVEDEMFELQSRSGERLATAPGQVAGKVMAVDGQGVWLVDVENSQLVQIGNDGEVVKMGASNVYKDNSQLVSTDRGLMLWLGEQVFRIGQQGQLSSPEGLSMTGEVVAVAGYGDTGYGLGDEGQIYRVPVKSDGFGAVSTYFDQPVKGKMVGLAVDGSVYVLRGDGGVDKYFAGKRVGFDLQHGELLYAPEAILTNKASDRLYVLQGGVVLMWNKKGGFEGGFRVEGVEDGVDMVGLGGEKVYVVAGGGVYEVGRTVGARGG